MGQPMNLWSSAFLQLKKEKEKLLKTKQEFFASYFVMWTITIVKFSGDVMAEQLTTPTLNL